MVKVPVMLSLDAPQHTAKAVAVVDTGAQVMVCRRDMLPPQLLQSAQVDGPPRRLMGLGGAGCLAQPFKVGLPVARSGVQYLGH